MKKHLLLIGALAVLIANSLTGCRKAQPSAGTETSVAPGKSAAMAARYTPSFRYYNYGKEITEDDFLKNDHDAKDQAFNYINHAMTLGLLEIYRQYPTLMAAIVSEIDASINKDINLYTVAQQHPEINDLMNRVFTERFNDFNGGNWQAYVREHYAYDTHYTPFIGFMNLGSVDATMPVYVSEPLELNEEKFNQFDDDYPMWVKEGDLLRFTSINEEMGYYMPNPVLRISNGFEGDDLVEYQKVPCRFEENGKDISKEAPGAGFGGGQYVPNPPGGGNQPPVDEWITHVQFQINERYENFGKSEYQFVWVTSIGYNANSGLWTTYNNNIRSIEKSLKKEQIGTMIPFYFDVFSRLYYPANTLTMRITNLSPANYCKFSVGAYERDWGAFHKWLFYTCAINGSASVPRKYYDEWYYLDPSYNDSYPFNVRNPAPHTSYWNYTKGVLQLHRWNL